MKRPTLLRLFMLALFLSQGACASISTLESARVVDDDTFAVETVILDRGYAEARKAERVTQESIESETDAPHPFIDESTPRIEPLSIALVARMGNKEELPIQTALSVSSAGTVMFGAKYQLIDAGPLAASAGFKIGSDVISLIDFFTDDPDEGDDDENDVWKKQVQFAIPLIVSLHPFDGLDIYSAGRIQWLGTTGGYHKLLVGAAGACIGTRFGICAEIGQFVSIGTGFDGYYGGFSLKTSGVEFGDGSQRTD